MTPKDRKSIGSYEDPPRKRRDLGPNSAGQSGDNQGLSDLEDVTNESVTELVEEGQYYEAAVVEGIENASDGDQKPLRPKQVKEDDVPQEYIDEDPGRPDV